MHRLPRRVGSIGDLMLAAGAIGDVQRIGIGGADGGVLAASMASMACLKSGHA
jgi:hypothetical protein